MIPNINNLVQLKENLYITDILDIFIISLLIYTLFIFLRKTRTVLIFIGIAFTVVLYLVSKFLNLYVTLLTLRYFVGVSVVIFAIIFQHEIRKYFEFLGLIGTRQIKVGPFAPKSPSTAEIIQACVKMSEDKIGALIVIEGKDTLDTFIDGGIPLDGVISEELLLSIFDDHSAGHDGAVIISNNRVSKFATHLPLSTDFKEIGKHGTRHSAALGLTEVSDALCIVVSEENGKISITRDSKLKTLAQYSDLEKELDKYMKNKFSTQSKNIMTKIFKHDFWIKLGATLMGMLIWFFVAYQADIVEKTFNVKINLQNLPDNLVLKDYSPKEVKILVSGRGESAFSKIGNENFIVKLDAGKIQHGINKLSINHSDIITPTNLLLQNVAPETILLTAQKFEIKEVPISLKMIGNVEDPLSLDSVAISPNTVKVWIPEGIAAPIEIETEILDISNQKDSIILPLKLVKPENIEFVDEIYEVDVAITISPKKEN